MKYKINSSIVIEDAKYGALADDFSSLDISTLDILINKIYLVMKNESLTEKIYGSICYSMLINKNNSEIFCYDEFLGSEPTIDVYNMLKDYRDKLSIK